MTKDKKKRIKERLIGFQKAVKNVCLRAGRSLEDVRILYATKYLTPEFFAAFLDICRQIDIGRPILIGENRVQEAREKVEYLVDGKPDLCKLFKYVMIGNLQKNKINKAIEIFDEIHSVDSLVLAKALDKRLIQHAKRLPVFLEVNISREESKHGFDIDKLDTAILAIKQLNNIAIKGLMTMAPIVDNPEKVRPIFKRLRLIADKYNLLTSMGMSSDWRVAVEEGADMIRIGGRLFLP